MPIPIEFEEIWNNAICSSLLRPYLVVVLSGFWCKCQWRPGQVWGFCGWGFGCGHPLQLSRSDAHDVPLQWILEWSLSLIYGDWKLGRAGKSRRLASEKEWSSVETSNILQPYLLLLPLRGSQQFQSFYTLPLSGQLCRQDDAMGKSDIFILCILSFKRWWHCQNPCQVFSEIQDELQAALEGEAAATWSYCQ